MVEFTVRDRLCFLIRMLHAIGCTGAQYGHWRGLIYSQASGSSNLRPTVRTAVAFCLFSRKIFSPIHLIIRRSLDEFFHLLV